MWKFFSFLIACKSQCGHVTTLVKYGVYNHLPHRTQICKYIKYIFRISSSHNVTAMHKCTASFPILCIRTTKIHCDTQAIITDSNGIAGNMRESNIATHLTIVLNCTDAHSGWRINCYGNLHLKLLWIDSFNDWWEGECPLGYYCQCYFSTQPHKGYDGLMVVCAVLYQTISSHFNMWSWWT